MAYSSSSSFLTELPLLYSPDLEQSITRHTASTTLSLTCRPRCSSNCSTHESHDLSKVEVKDLVRMSICRCSATILPLRESIASPVKSFWQVFAPVMKSRCSSSASSYSICSAKEDCDDKEESAERKNFPAAFSFCQYSKPVVTPPPPSSRPSLSARSSVSTFEKPVRRGNGSWRGKKGETGDGKLRSLDNMPQSLQHSLHPTLQLNPTDKFSIADISEAPGSRTATSNRVLASPFQATDKRRGPDEEEWICSLDPVVAYVTADGASVYFSPYSLPTAVQDQGRACSNKAESTHTLDTTHSPLPFCGLSVHRRRVCKFDKKQSLATSSLED